MLEVKVRGVFGWEKMPRKLKKDEQKFEFEELRARAVGRFQGGCHGSDTMLRNMAQQRKGEN